MLERLESRRVLDGDGVPWLVASDLSLSFAQDGTEIAGYESALFATLDALAPTADWQDVFVRALRTWAELIGTNVKVVGDQGDPFGVSGLTQGDPRFGDVRIGAVPLDSDVIAMSIPRSDVVAGTWAGDILFNSNAALNSINELFSVALHEAGHVFGLGHSADPVSVMFQHGISSALSPTEGDVVRIKQLYSSVGLVDEVFREHGERSEEDDDTMSETPVLTDVADLWGVKRLDAIGNISDPDDVDYYRIGPAFRTPEDLDVLTVTVWAEDASSLMPHVEILKPGGDVLVARILSNVDGRIVLQVEDAPPTTPYVVKVQAENAGEDIANGAYYLSVHFGANPTRLGAMGKGKLGTEQGNAIRVLRIAETSLIHLLLQVSPMESKRLVKVGLTVSDESGRILARIDSSPGTVRSAPTFLLSPGDYLVEITASGPSSEQLPEIEYTLRGTTISIPIGSVISDPSRIPTTVGDPVMPGLSAWTMLDTRVTAPLLRLTPPLLTRPPLRRSLPPAMPSPPPSPTAPTLSTAPVSASSSPPAPIEQVAPSAIRIE